jgi:hypothetical protein
VVDRRAEGDPVPSVIVSHMDNLPTAIEGIGA